MHEQAKSKKIQWKPPKQGTIKINVDASFMDN
jgi:hypothetical protein